MSKRNAGINDKPDASGEQSHVDGNSGLDHRVGGIALPVPPSELTREQQEQQEQSMPVPDQRAPGLL